MNLGIGQITSDSHTEATVATTHDAIFCVVEEAIAAGTQHLSILPIEILSALRRTRLSSIQTLTAFPREVLTCLAAAPAKFASASHFVVVLRFLWIACDDTCVVSCERVVYQCSFAMNAFGTV